MFYQTNHEQNQLKISNLLHEYKILKENFILLEKKIFRKFQCGKNFQFKKTK